MSTTFVKFEKDWKMALKSFKIALEAYQKSK